MPNHPAPILFVTRKWAPATGGMETWALRLSEALSALRPVRVLALKGRANGMPPGALALIRFGIAAFVQLLLQRATVRTVHLGDMALWPLGLAVAPQARLVLSAHGTDVAYHRRGGLKGWLYGGYLRLGARLLRHARVCANSRATMQVLAETGWQTAAVVPLATTASPNAAPTTEHDGRILFAGRLVPRKGCGWFIAHVLPLLGPDLRLKVAGTIWDDGEGALLRHPQVDYLGPLARDALAREYARSLCVILPNIAVPEGEFEGFGLIAPEAAAAGGLVLAADCDGLRDAVIDQETGLHLPAGNAGQWAEAITGIARWDAAMRRRFLMRAQSSSRATYSWDRVARDTIRLYDAA